jgi:hypothetical protein
MDAAYDALDTFTRACSLSSGVDIEFEAWAESYRGRILYKILNKPDKAQSHLFNAKVLADSLLSTSVLNTDWYKEAIKCLLELEEKFEKIEDQTYRTGEDLKSYNMIKGDLDEVNKALKKGDDNLLDHLNSKFNLGV